MAAHSRPFNTYCTEPGCYRRATEEVFNTFNARQGVYCKTHAAKRVAILHEGERAMLEAQTR